MPSFPIITPRFKRFLLNKRFQAVTLIIFIFFLYYYTNLFVDWSDIKNWKFKRRILSAHLYNQPMDQRYPGFDCSEFFSGKTESFRKYREWGRIVVDDNIDLPMDCDSVRKRIIGNGSYASVENPYAISRVIYKDYFWIETVLSQTYSPQNIYCFSVDLKSSRKIVEFMKGLEKCLPNVILSKERYDFDSNGHFLNFGHFECSEQLIKRKGWKYILWAQNHDLILRTNEEVSQIIAFLNGSQAIGHKPAQWKRYAVTKDWSAKALGLWRNEEKRSARQLAAVLNVSQNYNEVFISRELLQFVLEEINYRKLLTDFEVPYRFATDELFWATLIATPELELPGAPRSPCPDNRYYLTRYNEWEKWYNPPCKSGFSRHGTCIFGMEYLPMFTRLHHICVNKVMPDFDYGFVKCYGELLRERSLRKTHTSNMDIYMGDSRNNC